MRFFFSCFCFSTLVMLSASAGNGAHPWEFSIDGTARTVVESYHNLYFDITGEGDDSWVHQRVQHWWSWSGGMFSRSPAN